MIKSEKDLLPLGTLLKVKDAENTYCIVGYWPTGAENHLCNYIICNAAYGIIEKDPIIITDDNIEEVVIRGYENYESNKFKKEFMGLTAELSKMIKNKGEIK